MTVRVNKDSFNLREKLSELERPIGLKGSELMSAATTQEARDLVSAGRKNLIMNGDCRVDQRGTDFTNNSGSIYSLDRWHTHVYALGSARYRVEKSSDAPNGFHYSIKYSCTTIDSTPDVNHQIFTNLKIETNNINHLNFYQSNSSTVTISFFVKTNIAGTQSAALKLSNNNSGHTNGTTRSYNFTYTVNNPDTWEKKTKTITLDSSTAYSKSSPANFGMSIDFWIAAGTSRRQATANSWVNNTNNATNSNNLNFIGSTNNYVNFTGVQIELGKNATDFEHRSYGEELALCQRYYGKIRLSNQEWIYNESNLGSHKWHQIYIPFTMRSNPSIDVTDLTTGGSSAGLTGTINSIAPQQPGDTPGRISSRVTFSADGGTARNVYHYDGWNGDYVSLSAEL
jgi:hypothetical protein